MRATPPNQAYAPSVAGNGSRASDATATTRRAARADMPRAIEWNANPLARTYPKPTHLSVTTEGGKAENAADINQ